MSTNTKLKGIYHRGYKNDSCGFDSIANIDDKSGQRYGEWNANGLNMHLNAA